MRLRWTIAVLSLLLLLTACGDDKSTPTTPTPVQIDVTGRWATDITVQGISARMTWMLTQTATAAVSGPVTVGLSNGVVLLNGFLTGSLNGSSLPYTITVAPGGIPSQPSCSGQIAGTMTVATSVTSMSGNMAVTSSTCTIQLPTNTVSLTRQT